MRAWKSDLKRYVRSRVRTAFCTKLAATLGDRAVSLRERLINLLDEVPEVPESRGTGRTPKQRVRDAIQFIDRELVKPESGSKREILKLMMDSYEKAFFKDQEYLIGPYGEFLGPEDEDPYK